MPSMVYPTQIANIFYRVCKQNWGKSNCQLWRRLKPRKGLSSNSPALGQATGDMQPGRRDSQGTAEKTVNRKTEKARTENSGHVRVHAWVANYKFITRFSMWQLQICAVYSPPPCPPPPPSSLSCLYPLGSWCWPPTSFATCLRLSGRCACLPHPFHPVCVLYFFFFFFFAWLCLWRGMGSGGAQGRNNIMWHWALRIEVAMSQCRAQRFGSSPHQKTKT